MFSLLQEKIILAFALSHNRYSATIHQRIQNLPMIYIRQFSFLAIVLLPISFAITLVKYQNKNSKEILTPIIINNFTYFPLNNQQSLLGNPDKAKSDPRNHKKYLSKKSQFDLSYNDNQHIANWVSWHLEKGDLGKSPRDNKKCRYDKDLPKNFMPINGNDYKPSTDKYAKGHVCPHADRNDTPQNSDSTFVMSNIMPQNPDLNKRHWKNLENETREQIKKGNECYIISGGGFNSNKHKMIGAKNIHVPDWYWKIIVILPQKEGNDLARITPATRVIAVEMPNLAPVSEHQWRDYRVAPALIEKKTRLKFFSALPHKVADALRNKIDNG
jgi:endonuclease G, mitochondrial